jgi:hypothetical protein
MKMLHRTAIEAYCLKEGKSPRISGLLELLS